MWNLPYSFKSYFWRICWNIFQNAYRAVPSKHSTLKYVEITSRRRSTWYPRWFNVDLSPLIQQWNSTLKQRWFCVDSKRNFVLISWHLENYNLYINVEKITLFQRRNNVILSTWNQRWNLTLKQCWFWVDTENNFILMS